MLGTTKVGFQNGWKYPSISPTKVRNKNKTDMDQISNRTNRSWTDLFEKNLSIYLIALATVSGVRWDLVPFNFWWIGLGRLGSSRSVCHHQGEPIHQMPSHWRYKLLNEINAGFVRGNSQELFFWGFVRIPHFFKETSNLCKCQHASASSTKEPLEPHNFLLGGWFRVAKNGSPPITSQKVIQSAMTRTYVTYFKEYPIDTGTISICIVSAFKKSQGVQYVYIYILYINIFFIYIYNIL